MRAGAAIARAPMHRRAPALKAPRAAESIVVARPIGPAGGEALGWGAPRSSNRAVERNLVTRGCMSVLAWLRLDQNWSGASIHLCVLPRGMTRKSAAFAIRAD